jgi:threonine 3-dehydrogenase
VIGHEFVGDVVGVGRDVEHIRPGTRISAEGHITCGHCPFCRTGQAHICQTVKILGIDRDGCFADYLVMPADNLWPVPAAVPDRYAAILDPLGNAMHTVMEAPPAGKSVLIVGAGAIGLFAVAIAKASGAAMIAVIEPNEMRRGLAKQAGADLVFDPAQENVEDDIREQTGGLGPEIVLEMSGNVKGFRQAFRLIRNGGHICLLGIPPGEVPLRWADDVIFKGITIHGISGRRMYDTWYQCQTFLLHNRLRLDPLITHIIPADDFQRGFQLLKEGKAAKVVLKWRENDVQTVS